MVLLSPRRPIALVLGATVGGLTAAKGLQRCGYKVKVVDSALSWTEVLRKPDVGLVLPPRSFIPLQYLDAIPNDALYSDYLAWRNVSGTIKLPSIPPFSSEKSISMYDGILYTSKSALLQSLRDKTESFDPSLTIHRDSTVKGIVPIEYHLGLLLDRVRNQEYRGDLSRYNGEFADPPLQSVFVASSTLEFKPKQTILDKVNVFEEKKLDHNAIFDSDTIVIADDTPSWARRRLMPQSYRTQYPIFTENITISGVLNCSDLPPETTRELHPYTTFSGFNWVMLHPVDSSKQRFAFTALIYQSTESLKSKKFLARYEGPLVDEMKEILTSSFKQCHVPIPSIIDAIVQNNNLEVVYNPIHWRDSPVFSFNRIAYSGETAKLHFPSYNQTASIDIEESWAVVKKLAPVTSISLIKELRENNKQKGKKAAFRWSRPKLRLNYSITSALEEYGKQRKGLRCYLGEMRSYVFLAIARKHVGETKPLGLYPEILRECFHRHRVLPKVLGWDYRFSNPPPENMARTRTIDAQINISLQRDKRESSFTGRMCSMIGSALKALTHRNYRHVEEKLSNPKGK